MTRLFALTMLACLTAGAAAAADAVIPHCLVSLMQDIEVPAQEAGLIVEMGVRDGDLVQRGAVVALIDDEKAQLEKFASERQLRAALAKANDDIEVRFAEASLKVAAADLEMNLDVNKRRPGTVPESEIRRQRLARERAELQIDKSKLDLQVARMEAEIREAEVRAADANIARRRVLAPIQGMVADVLRERGEWVDAGQPVARVVRIDRLRVEGFLVVSDHDPEEIAGKPVTVEIELARGRRERFAGTVVFVSPLVEAGMKYRVRAEVENRQQNGHWLLRPGMAAQMTIHAK